MGLFKPATQRPTMADRRDNQTERMRPWWASAAIKELSNDFNRKSRHASHRDEQARNYRGSKTEASHRRGFFR